MTSKDFEVKAGEYLQSMKFNLDGYFKGVQETLGWTLQTLKESEPKVETKKELVHP